MGEARRRAAQGLPPANRTQTQDPKPPGSFHRLAAPHQEPDAQFVDITTRGAWIGIGAMVLFWITVRFIGPAAGWWTLADMP